MSNHLRTGLISDIHGNHAGLLMALAKLNQEGCDRIICLGDLVDGGTEEAQVVDHLRALALPTVCGNHDVCNMADIGPERQQWLKNLPDTITDGDFLFTHVSPRKKRKHKIADAVEAWNVFDETSERLIFVGHTHFSCIFGERCDQPVTAREVPFRFGEWTNLDPTDRYIISVGAVGYSRDHLQTIRCGIIDAAAKRLIIWSLPGPMVPVG
jgi:predicted phosphodiesterase